MYVPRVRPAPVSAQTPAEEERSCWWRRAGNIQGRGSRRLSPRCTPPWGHTQGRAAAAGISWRGSSRQELAAGREVETKPRSPTRPPLRSRGAGGPTAPDGPRRQLNFAESFLPSGTWSHCCFHQHGGVGVSFYLFIYLVISILFIFTHCIYWHRLPIPGRGTGAAQPGPALPGPGGCVSPWLGLLKKGLPREVSGFKWRRCKAETMETKLSFLFCPDPSYLSAV